ncbi:MAG: cobalt-zinc-cadmium efflux system protein [Paraglaciecola sp.]
MASQQHHHEHHASHHGHHHHIDPSSTRIGWAFVLNFSFTIIEFIGGWLTNSTAIMADAVHDLGDSLSIGSAWYLQKVGGKQATDRFTYGFKRLSLMGAMINGVVLVSGSLWVLFAAVPRLFAPQMPHTEGMFLIALLGVAVNGFAAYKLSGGKTLNERILNWHLLEDVLGWVAVLIVSVVLMFVNLPILDPLLSIAFTLFILYNVVRNLRETTGLFLQGTPDDGVHSKIKETLLSIDPVGEVHHMHFWSLDGENHVLTAHLVLTQMLPSERLMAIKGEVAKRLDKYHLAHTTIEFEFPDEGCRDA